MAEEVNKRDLADKINLKKVIYGSERSSVSMRRKISELLGGVELFDIPGMTELYGPGTGIECPDHDCIHYWADYYILEILDPETLTPVPDGEWGEMVVTSLCKEAAPLIRYRTGDQARLLPDYCPCGSMLRRLGKGSSMQHGETAVALCRQAGIEPDRNHLPQPSPIPGEQLLSRDRVSLGGPLDQFHWFRELGVHGF